MSNQLPPDLLGHLRLLRGALLLPQIFLMYVSRAVLMPEVTVSLLVQFEYIVWRPMLPKAPFPQVCANTRGIVLSAKIQFPRVF